MQADDGWAEDGPECKELALRPAAGEIGEAWRLRKEDGLLALMAPDGRTVMMLPTEEAARNIRFEWDLVRGRIVSFSLAEGMRGHRFRCGKDTVKALLAWLPEKAPRDQEREIVRGGAALVAFGTLLLLFPEFVFRGWGLACVVLGLFNLLAATRTVYAVNGCVLLVLGAVVLFLPLPPRFAPSAASHHLFSTGAGAVLLIWAVQQFSLLSPAQRLHVARTEGQRPLDTSGRSRLVLAVAAFSLLFSLLMGAHVAGIYWQANALEAYAPVNEVILYAAPMLVLFAAAAVLAFRKRPSYTEAKLAGQFIIVLLVLYLAGFAACLATGAAPFPAGALQAGVNLAVRLYVWAPIVLLVLAFNRQFGRRVRREVEARIEE